MNMHVKPGTRGALRRQGGTTLVEALAALLILSIGLLGVAGLQISALRANHGALLRSQATELAHDITDRMRANRTAALAGDYSIALGSTPSGTALSDIDLIAWKQTLGVVLPGGDGAVASAGNLVTVTIQWSDRLGTDVFTTETEL